MPTTFVTADLYKKFHEYFNYEDGTLFWKKSPTTWIKPGSRAGSLRSDGYYEIGFLGKSWLAHRIIFLIHHGHMPDLIDHKDRNPSNNRVENLRESDKIHNSHNSKIQVNNTSGYKGVSWDKRKGKWCARAKSNGRYMFLGYHASAQEASAAYEDFVRKGGSV